MLDRLLEKLEYLVDKNWVKLFEHTFAGTFINSIENKFDKLVL